MRSIQALFRSPRWLAQSLALLGLGLAFSAQAASIQSARLPAASGQMAVGDAITLTFEGAQARDAAQGSRGQALLGTDGVFVLPRRAAEQMCGSVVASRSEAREPSHDGGSVGVRARRPGTGGPAGHQTLDSNGEASTNVRSEPADETAAVTWEAGYVAAAVELVVGLAGPSPSSLLSAHGARNAEGQHDDVGMDAAMTRGRARSGSDPAASTALSTRANRSDAALRRAAARLAKARTQVVHRAPVTAIATAAESVAAIEPTVTEHAARTAATLSAAATSRARAAAAAAAAAAKARIPEQSAGGANSGVGRISCRSLRPYDAGFTCRN